ncbi:MAG: host-nuclease inhibitor Gam family protein [Verrucomicrobia bacterium]|nr:host-nuclease inhibitor Gam family protein [Verrucomicrobiota bacterium]
MKNKRLKLAVPAIQTREQMEKLVGDICAATIRQDALLAEMDHKLKTVRENYEDRLAGIQQELDGNLALAQDWAEAHPSEFEKRKSIEMVHGVVGWRTGQHKAKPLSGWTWEKVLAAIGDIPHFAACYIRTIKEVNKEALISDRDIIPPEELRKIGVRIFREETFFIEPKREEAPPTEIHTGAAKEAA